MSDKTIEEKYKKYTDREHVLKRPDTYVGSMRSTPAKLYTCANIESNELIMQEFEYIPALYKIFDEVLVNAYDHYIRCYMAKNIDTEQVTQIKVDIGKDYISIYNNGPGIPVVIHKDEKKYVPSMIFGELRTGENYDDDEEKITGGKNGFGAKLANILSKKFIIETVDSNVSKKFVQEFGNNMEIVGKEKITSSKVKSYTKITFYPDFTLFSGESGEKMKTIDGFDDVHLCLFKKRVYDMTAVTGDTVCVYFNGTKLPEKSFEKYVEKYIGLKGDYPRVYEKVSDRWEIIATHSRDNSLEHISFVNGIYTAAGGAHVDYIANQIAKKIVAVLKKKAKKDETIPKETHVRDNLFVFMKCSIVNPEFTSQTKEYMKTVMRDFGSKCNLSDKFIDEIMKKTDVVKRAMRLSEFKTINSANTTTTGRKRINIPKYESANWAGTDKAHECVLILTEGDSAKASILSGLSVVGRDKFGVFPLRGKLLNVRDVSLQAACKNEEINHIREIMGLEYGKKYEVNEEGYVSGLRYGGIMLATDFDVDGHHIKGLLINYIHHFWSSLIKIDNFVKYFKTPIVIASKGNKKTKNYEKVCFYNMNNFLDWRKEVSGQWKIKYYKGLGTSDRLDFQEYFENYDKHKVDYYNDDEEDPTEDITLAFAKVNADNRKKWLANYDKDNVIEADVTCVRYKDFIHKELIHFSNYDNIRSIPNVCDGLKPSQRKIMYFALKNLKNDEQKVAQVSGLIASKTAYHHGEVSLQGAIVNMAQNYVGSNNINLLTPSGQFGTRNIGGKDHASSRYIYTMLEKISSVIFNSDDNVLLKYCEDDDGNLIEPEWFIPIIPMVLVNGIEGIGTGYATDIPCFNPKDIVQKLLYRMEFDNEGDTLVYNEWGELTPWFRGFKGKVIANEEGKYETVGCYEIVSDGEVLITELPIGTWTQNYREYLDSLLIDKTEKSDTKKNKQCLTNYDNQSGDAHVHFKLKFSPTKWKSYKNDTDALEKLLKLRSATKCHITNMCLFDHMGKIKHYKDVKDILEEFYNVRLEYYVKRRKCLLDKYLLDLNIYKEKIRFIEGIISNNIVIQNKSDEEILTMLTFKSNEFYKLIENGKLLTKDDLGSIEDNMRGYEYLLGMSLKSLTMKKKEELEKKCKDAQVLYDNLLTKDSKDMWKEDLELFMKEYDCMTKEWEEYYADIINNKKSASKSKTKTIRAKKKII